MELKVKIVDKALLETLKKKVGAEQFSSIVNNALTFYEWVIERVGENKKIIALDERGNYEFLDFQKGNAPTDAGKPDEYSCIFHDNFINHMEYLKKKSGAANLSEFVWNAISAFAMAVEAHEQRKTIAACDEQDRSYVECKMEAFSLAKNFLAAKSVIDNTAARAETETLLKRLAGPSKK